MKLRDNAERGQASAIYMYVVDGLYHGGYLMDVDEIFVLADTTC